MVEAIEVGFQFPLSGEFQILQVPVIDTPVVDEERALKRKRGLLLRILSSGKDGNLYRDIERIEANFKAGGTREAMYSYSTRDGRKEVLATPEDLRWVLATRRNTAFERQTNR